MQQPCLKVSLQVNNLHKLEKKKRMDCIKWNKIKTSTKCYIHQKQTQTDMDKWQYTEKDL